MALRTSLAQGADDWQKLWALLCGLALTAPPRPADAMDETARELFPDIKHPYESRWPRRTRPPSCWRTGDWNRAAPGRPRVHGRPGPLVARDVYGSRLLLAAPFGYGGDAPDHWYAWDIDSCWIDRVVGAGVFASAEDALREWRGAAGPTASDAVLSPCGTGTTARLLAACLPTGALADMLEGSEPRELIREYYRLRRRARDLIVPATPAPAHPRSTPATWIRRSLAGTHTA